MDIILCVYWPRRNELYKTVLIHPAQPLVSEGLMVSDFEGLTHGKVTSRTLTRYTHSDIHNIIFIFPFQVSYDLVLDGNPYDNIVRIFLQTLIYYILINSPNNVNL